MSDTIELTYEDEDGEEITIEVPSKMEVCYDCEGHGMVLNESMRNYAYTSEDEEMHDPEFREEYFKRGGIYDVVCPTCKGKNVLAVPDEETINKNEKLKSEYEKYEEWKEDRDRADAEYEAECRMERLMGC